jgi:hypothetical protein
LETTPIELFLTQDLLDLLFYFNRAERFAEGTFEEHANEIDRIVKTHPSPFQYPTAMFLFCRRFSPHIFGSVEYGFLANSSQIGFFACGLRWGSRTVKANGLPLSG